MAAPGEVTLRLLLNIACTCALAGAISCGGGGGGSPSKPIQKKATVTITPSSATVPVGTIHPFGAFVSGTTPREVRWTASAGTIETSGVFHAPDIVPAGGKATVTATSAVDSSVSASVSVTITTDPVTIEISPKSATVRAGLTQYFRSTIEGTTYKVANWSVNDPLQQTYPGEIPGGLYFAPWPVSTSSTFDILAESAADPSKRAAASVTVIPVENQQKQATPISLGTSGFNSVNTACCGGTLGALLKDDDGKHYILSNNHVLGKVGIAAPGEDIVHPSPIESFCDLTVPFVVAHFTAAPDIHATAIDAAVAQVVEGVVDPNGSIIGLGGFAQDGTLIPGIPASATTTPQVGMQIAKSGRTTALTCGTVLGIDASLLVEMGGGCGTISSENIILRGEIVMPASMVSPGDSGSLVVDAATARPVGLVNAGSSTLSAAHAIEPVLAALNTATGSHYSFVGGAEHAVECAAPSTSSTSELSTRRVRLLSDSKVATAKRVRNNYERELMRDPAVLGVAVGRAADDSNTPAVLLLVETGKKLMTRPAMLDGVPVRVIETDRFRAGIAVGRMQSCSAPVRDVAVEAP